MHHFDGAAGKAERHGPERGLPRPVRDLIKSCSGQSQLVGIYTCTISSPNKLLPEFGRSFLEN